MANILNPYADDQPEPKHIVLRARSGQAVSADFTLQDRRGRQSAAEYLFHLYSTIKQKLDEPVLDTAAPSPDDQAAMQRLILYSAGAHDTMFGTFNGSNTSSEMPEEQRNEFVEIFLLACATVIEGQRITVDLQRGLITADAA
ncbi:hypothetical protein [Thioalkalivibrio sp. AKL19]|uniref:hypothetical protein n=1 Tax=Thioalkalivibrio sp. AKL19 TaxID=1266914 RepID=UPI000418FBDD|nr:hypothetical protein [Thioalkalivibrio sp. AKL19]